MDSKIRKTIRKNTAGIGAGRQKKICPMCVIRFEEIVMVFDNTLKQYTCNICGYKAPRHLDPIGDSVIEAGNSEEAIRPYMKSVQMHKRPLFTNRVTDKYDTPLDAWQNDNN
jgi:hypothetical protein